MKPKVIAIAGPTASGKTSLSIKMAETLNGEIVSADSRLVYKGFDIVSAKPTVEEMKNIPHHMIDIVEPEVNYSVGDYSRDAKKVIDDILNRGKLPIITGGTGLYFRVLLENYNLPEVETDYKLRAQLEEREKDDLLQELKDIDEITYNKIFNANKRRIVRALEIIKSLGKPLSQLELQKEPEYEVEWIMPEVPSREWLYDRINRRVDLMIEMGLIEETKNMLQRHGRINNFVSTIGYQEILEYLDNKTSLDNAVEKIKQHTRNYAKRQITWFRKNPAFKSYLNI